MWGSHFSNNGSNISSSVLTSLCCIWTCNFEFILNSPLILLLLITASKLEKNNYSTASLHLASNCLKSLGTQLASFVGMMVSLGSYVWPQPGVYFNWYWVWFRHQIHVIDNSIWEYCPTQMSIIIWFENFAVFGSI